MAGLKEIRIRIASVKTTRQVTSAMKIVSAAKLKKAQDAIYQIRPYANKLQGILSSLSASLENAEDSVYTQQREPEKVLIVLISSNRGMCGGFNSNISKKAAKLVHEKYSIQHELGNVQFLCIGKQGMRQMKYHGMKVVDNKNEIFNALSFENISVIALDLMKAFEDGSYDRIEIVYNQFKNAAIQIQTAEQFLPIEIKKDDTVRTNTNYIYEPSKEYIIQELIPRILKIQFYKAMLDSHAAEHGARLTAMHQSTDNATELLNYLTLQYNKARQAAITGEILEIVSGAEALKG
ncbi:MAG TPA: ATP synthase F1 subunit gamma [Draconibacterium sp.]|nr:ATP synthase F1 subunit gamma [Draconibacterium sp.]